MTTFQLAVIDSQFSSPPPYTWQELNAALNDAESQMHYDAILAIFVIRFPDDLPNPLPAPPVQD